MSQNLYLVPHDFTAVGDVALRYAMHIGKRVKTEIQVVHIVTDASKVTAAKQKLDLLIQSFEKPSNVELTSLVEVGNIFEDISKIARKDRAQLIIMGTHGAVGMQKLFGSHAIKVITSADVPFLVVQEKTPVNEVKNIIVPIDLTKESLQITNIAGDLAAMFDAELHVTFEKMSDQVLRQKMNTRVTLVRNSYEDRKLKSHFIELDGSGSYHKKIIDYAKKVNADQIAIAYHTESLLPQFDKFAQSLITNDLNLPCVIINSKSASSLYF